MADPEPNAEGDGDGLPVIDPAAPPCRHLRSKGMYVYTDMADDPHEESDTTAYWCLRSMTSFGPDDEAVRRLDCRNPERSCYEPI
jgi:hypothetical protein